MSDIGTVLSFNFQYHRLKINTVYTKKLIVILVAMLAVMLT